MLVYQVVVLCNVPVVEVGNPEVKQDVEQEGEIEQCGIQTVGTGTNGVLYSTVDTQDPEGLDGKIQDQQEGEVGDKFPLHGG